MGHIQRRHLDEPVRVPGAGDVKRLDELMTGLWDTALAAEIESLKLIDDAGRTAAAADVGEGPRQGRREVCGRGAVMVSEAEWEEQMLDALSFHGWIPTSGKAVAPGR